MALREHFLGLGGSETPTASVQKEALPTARGQLGPALQPPPFRTLGQPVQLVLGTLRPCSSPLGISLPSWTAMDKPLFLLLLLLLGVFPLMFFQGVGEALG